MGVVGFSPSLLDEDSSLDAVGIRQTKSRASAAY